MQVPRSFYHSIIILPMLGIGFYPDLTLQLWNQKAQEIVSLSLWNSKFVNFSFLFV
jgi:hypothetical protein